MEYKDILVYLDPLPDTENRLNFAAGLAVAHGARLIGMDACSDAAFEGEWRDHAVGLQDLFIETIKQKGLQGEFLDTDRWRNGGQHHYAHYVDLVVATQLELEVKDLVISGIPEDVLLAAGVPVLLLPSGWKPRVVGENIVIAWKSSREATRAVHDAMPFLTRAKKVTAFTFAPQPDIFGKEPDSLVNHLRQHGVSAEASSWPNKGDISAVDALFSCLDTQDADLIVAGAYGHSRWLEGLFGGVTRDLTSQPMLPLLMSH